MASNRLEIIIGAVDQASNVLDQVGRAIARQKEQLQGLDTLSRQYTETGRRQMAVAAGIAAAIGATVKPALDLDQGLRNVNSIAKLSETGFRDMRRSVLEIAKDPLVTDMPRTLAAGLYDINSSGLSGASALDTLRIASRGAAAGMSETSTSARVLVSVMNAYNRKTGRDAVDIMDMLFQIVDRGVVTFDELAQYLAMSSTTAAQAGVPLEQLGAAFMTMTKQGHNAAVSSTALNQVILTFLNPNKQLLALMKQQGYESGLQILKTRGLAGAIEWLNGAVNGQTDQLVSMLGEVRAVRAAMSLTGSGARMFAEDLAAAGNHAGAMERALAEQSKGGLFQWRATLKDLTIAATEFGEVFLPASAAVARGMRAAASAASELPQPVKAAAGGVLLFAAAGLAAAGAVNLVRGALLRQMIMMQVARAAQASLTAETIAGTGAMEAQAVAAGLSRTKWGALVTFVRGANIGQWIANGANLAKTAWQQLLVVAQVSNLKAATSLSGLLPAAKAGNIAGQLAAMKQYQATLTAIKTQQAFSWSGQWQATTSHIGRYITALRGAEIANVSAGVAAKRAALGIGTFNGAMLTMRNSAAAAWGGVLRLVPAIKSVGLALRTFMLSPVGLTITAIGALTYELYKLYGVYKEMKAAQEQEKAAKARLADFEKQHGVVRDPKTGAVLSIARPTSAKGGAQAATMGVTGAPKATSGSGLLPDDLLKAAREEQRMLALQGEGPEGAKRYLDWIKQRKATEIRDLQGKATDEQGKDALRIAQEQAAQEIAVAEQQYLDARKQALEQGTKQQQRLSLKAQRDQAKAEKANPFWGTAMSADQFGMRPPKLDGMSTGTAGLLAGEMSTGTVDLRGGAPNGMIQVGPFYVSSSEEAVRVVRAELDRAFAR